jgi:putative transposase
MGGLERKPKQRIQEEKVAILRRHLVEKVPVSNLCEESGVHPTVFYSWLKQFFEQGGAAFSPPERASRREESLKQRVEALEAKLRRKGEVLPELMEEHVALKKSWEDLKGQWTPHDTRNQVIDFVRRWSRETEITECSFVLWLGMATSKFYNGQERYGKVNEHNGWVPRDFWLEVWEKRATVGFHCRPPLEGTRRLTFMMLDANVAAVSPASVWRALSAAGRLAPWNRKASSKGKGFQAPLAPHQH